jgi:hypothetical protein
MTDYRKIGHEIGRNAAGVVAANIPSYAVCLAATQDPLNALKWHGINTVARAVVGFGGALFWNEDAVFLAAPEILFFMGGRGLYDMASRRKQKPYEAQ